MTMAERPGPDKTVADEAFLRSIRNDYRPVRGTVGIANDIGMTQQGATQRLRKLEADGLVNTDKIGRSRIWWLTDAGRRYLSESESDSQ